MFYGQIERPSFHTAWTLLGHPAFSRSTRFEQFEIARADPIGYRAIQDLIEFGLVKRGFRGT
jgi:hypothetical protein